MSLAVKTPTATPDGNWLDLKPRIRAVVLSMHIGLDCISLSIDYISQSTIWWSDSRIIAGRKQTDNREVGASDALV